MTAALDRVTAVSGDANVKAFLQVIREGESNHDETAYTMLNGGTHFQAPPWVHPFAGQSAPPGLAAGAYQFIPHTWERCQIALGLDDFSPVSQDVAAVYLIDSAGALSDVMQGNLVSACARLASTWVSLPALGSERVQQVFQRFGGTVGAVPNIPAPPPQTEKPMGAALMFLPMILQMIPQLLKIPGLQNIVNQVPLPTATGSPHAADYMPLVQSIIDAFTQGVPGAVNTQQAVEMAQADAKVAAAASQAVLSAPDVVEQLNKLKPVLDSLNQYDKDAWAAEEASRNAAAARGIQQQDSGPLYSNPTFIIAILILILVFVVVLAVLFKGGFSTDMQAFVIGAIVGSALTAVISFYFGSSRNSAAKDATISQLANK